MENTDFNESDKKFIDEYICERKGFTAKGKVVCLEGNSNEWFDNFPQNKNNVSLHLALALEDEDNLAWYEKIARERRRDLLKNCLRKTLEASRLGVIKKTKAAYFCGVLKNKTELQKRLEEYKIRLKI